MPKKKVGDSSVNLFLRKATGLVRSWSVFDAFIYATFSINLITLGLYSFSQMYYLEGGLLPTLIISGLFIIFEVVVYAAMIAVMPRSGGDYVWQSRILGGGIGFVLAVTGWWFILWLWVPLYGDMLRHIFLSPLLAITGARDAALWIGQSSLGLFLTSVAVCLIAALFVALGMKWYARIQKICFWIGMAGLLVVFGMLLFGNRDLFAAGLQTNLPKLYGSPSDVIAATNAAGQEAGAAAPLFGGSIKAIFLTIPFIVFFNLWPNWGTTLYGEIRGANDFKRNFLGMAAALIVTTILAAIFFLLINKTMGWDFYMNANGAWWNYAWGYTSEVPPIPVWPYPALLTALMSNSPLIQFAIIFAMGMWWFGWAGTVFLSSTRIIFAAAFDRLLPEKVAEVHPKSRTPIYALLLMVLPSLVVSALFAWNVFNFRSLTLDSTLVIAVTFLGTTIAAAILPFRKPDLYRASPIVKFKILGIPLITIAGIIFGSFLIFLLYLWLVDPLQLYGIGIQNTSSIIFILVLYSLAAVIYFSFKAYRKKSGIDLDKVHKEIPVE